MCKKCQVRQILSQKIPRYVKIIQINRHDVFPRTQHFASL
jgi:hypothetical protein